MSRHRVVPAGDSVLVLEFDERIDPVVSAKAAAVAEALDAAGMPGIRDVVPTYRSVAVYFDALQADRAALTEALETLAERPVPERQRTHRAAIEIPVCYGGDFGPDLVSVAAVAGLTETEVVALHSGVTYQVLMIGFMPGFAYLGTVDPRIAVPRLATPRPRVSRGSVGLARQQTGIYPGDGPGGWQLIGRTPLRPFDLSRTDPFLFRAGDDVRFVPVTRSEFDELDRTS